MNQCDSLIIPSGGHRKFFSLCLLFVNRALLNRFTGTSHPTPHAFLISTLNLLKVSADVRILLYDTLHSSPEPPPGANGGLVLKNEVTKLEGREVSMRCGDRIRIMRQFLAPEKI